MGSRMICSTTGGERRNSLFQAVLKRSIVCLLLWQVVCSTAAGEISPTPEALFQAAKNADSKKITELLGKGVPVDAVDSSGKTALMAAGYLGHDEAVGTLLAAGANANVRDRYGSTALMEAAREGRDSIVKLLLEKRTVVRTDYTDMKSLLLAAKAKQGGLKEGIEIDARDKKGRTALHLAAMKGRLKVVELLIANEANTAIRDNAGQTASDLALQAKFPHVAARIAALSSPKSEQPAPPVEPPSDSEPGKSGDRSMDTSRLSPILRAVETGDKVELQKILKSGALVNEGDEQAVTPLMHAVRKSDKEIVALLLNFGADPDMKTADGMDAPTIAEREKKPELSEMMRNLDKNSRTLLHAAMHGNHEEIQSLLHEGAYSETSDETGGTPLMYAAASRCLKCAATLLEHGARPNTANREGETALLPAVETCDYQMADLLIEAGADPFIKDKTGYHALRILYDLKKEGNQGCVMIYDNLATRLSLVHPGYQLIEAAHNGRVGAVRALLDEGANPDIENEFEMTALGAAAGEGHKDVVKLLLSKGASVGNALLKAAESGNPECVKMLIKAGAELPGALGVAVKHGRIDAARALLDAGADVNEAYTDESTGYISTPLILATKENKPELALILVEKGADPSRKDSDGHTALDYAKKSGNESLLAALHAPRAGSPAKKR